MENEVITLAKYLKLDEYNIVTDAKDPGNENIFFLLKVAKLIPKTPEKLTDIDPGLIATYCLAAIQTVNVKYTKALMWQRLRKVDMDKVLGGFIRNAEKATTAEKIAKSEPAYEAAATLHGLADSYVEFYKNMLENFRATHYWAREQESQAREERKVSGYEPDFKEGGLWDSKKETKNTVDNSNGQPNEDVDFSQ